MKIIKLTFENINSYEGEVTIDFTDPGFLKGNNQFVVCGPMGSGKSTILDAITLALYGSTDRLDRLTTSSTDNSNELINKHSGYCRAEVVYSCAKGVFESIFEMRKAYGKVDGTVKAPQCAVYEIVGGERGREVLGRTTTEALRKKTEENIGLSYDQFIRCILIPQGEFDRFLKSTEREKAGILAKLSHTEHYKEAAVILNNRASSINRDYEKLKDKRDAITVMSEEERKKCEEEKADLQKQAGEFDKETEELLKKINWLSQLEKAEGDYRKAGEALNGIKAEAEEYARKTEELDNARKAEDCAVEYRSLQDCVNEQKDIQEQQNEAQEKLAKYASDKEEAGKASKNCAEAYIKKQEERDKQKELWAKVRSVDTEISVAQNDRDSKKEAMERSNKDLEDKKASYARLEDCVNGSAVSIKELSDYLEANKADGELEAKLATFKEKRKAWKDAVARLTKAEEELKLNKEKKEQLQDTLNDLIKQKEEIEAELHDLVSSKYRLVAGILRKDLKPGTACPVCGKEYVSGDAKEHEDHVHSHADISGEEESVAGDISDLNEKLEAKEEEINSVKDELQSVENRIRTATENTEQERSALAGLITEFNTMLQPWDKHVDGSTSEEGFDGIEVSLCDRKDQYTGKKEELDRLDRECEKAKAGMKSIDLKKLQEERDETENKYNDAERKFRELERKRQDLFGTRSVDDAERAFDEDIREKEKEKRAAEERLQETVKLYDTTNTRIEGYKTRNTELKDKQDELAGGFHDKLAKNGFASEDEFRSCLRSKQEMSDLDDSVKEYEHKKTVAETTYKNTKEAFDKLHAEALTTESSETLNAARADLEKRKKTCNEEFGGLKRKLDEDDRNRKLWEDANAELLELGTEAETFNRIKEMLGKNDGSDFEVFVQGIAMRSLLDKANVYLESIIPRYRLVQRSDNSIDFLVKETTGDLTVINREIKNFSGGEKFIISLSLALAMAEFAGQNGDVECIFLDEGFGTLSGTPLLDAINALKRLSSTGKMLGIITHIETVIQAFNKIEARKTGEKSILYGPGVTYTEKSKKKN